LAGAGLAAFPQVSAGVWVDEGHAVEKAARGTRLG
jgi:hypothetical protein